MGVPEVARVKARVLLVQVAVVQVGTEAVPTVEGAMEDTSSSTMLVSPLMWTRLCASALLLSTTKSSKNRRVVVIVRVTMCHLLRAQMILMVNFE